VTLSLHLDMQCNYDFSCIFGEESAKPARMSLLQSLRMSPSHRQRKSLRGLLSIRAVARPWRSRPDSRKYEGTIPTWRPRSRRIFRLPESQSTRQITGARCRLNALKLATPKVPAPHAPRDARVALTEPFLRPASRCSPYVF
jgi:hypothetical protein